MDGGAGGGNMHSAQPTHAKEAYEHLLDQACPSLEHQAKKNSESFVTLDGGLVILPVQLQLSWQWSRWLKARKMNFHWVLSQLINFGTWMIPLIQKRLKN